MIMVHIRQPFNFVTKLNGFFIVMKLLISIIKILLYIQ